MKKVVMLILLTCCFLSTSHASDRNILWNKVHDQCEPHYTSDGKYAPCTLVDQTHGYVFYKVDNDKYQYLLLPTEKISGIEDSQLLSDKIPNYFYMSWWGRDLISEKLDRNIQEKNISLTVNSLNTRSQDQLHIHISCLAKPVREAIERFDYRDLDNSWYIFPEKLQGYTFNFKKISLSEFKNINVFKDVSDKVTKDGGEMKYSTIAVVNLDKDNFLILQATGNTTQRIGAEKLQDHTCSLAR